MREGGPSPKEMGLTPKQKTVMKLAAAGLASAGIFGAAKYVESKGGVEEVFEGIRQENTEKKIDQIKRESGHPVKVDVDHRGLSGIFNDSGWKEEGIDFTEYRKALESLEENKDVDFNNLQPGQDVFAYKKLDLSQ